MRDHAVTAVQGVLHGAPHVLFGCGLDVPHVTSITVELAALDSSGDGVGVADGTTSSVYEPCTLKSVSQLAGEGLQRVVTDLLEVLEELLVDEAFCTLVQRAVHSDNITLRRPRGQTRGQSDDYMILTRETNSLRSSTLRALMAFAAPGNPRIV